MTGPIQVAVAILLLAVIAAIAVGALARFFPEDPDGARFLRWLFLASVFVRTAIAVGSFLFLPYGFLAPDEAGYVGAAPPVAVAPAPENPPGPAARPPAWLPKGVLKAATALSGRGWPYFNNQLGRTRLLPRLWNCVIGSLTPILCYALARRLGAGRAARLSAILAAFFPSLLLWSSLNLKDADVGLLVAAGLLLAIQPQALRIRYLAGILGIGVILVVLLSLREYAAAALAASVGVALVTCSGLARWVGARPYRRIALGVLIAGLVAVVLIRYPGMGETMYRQAGLEQLAHLRRGFAVGAGSATNPNPGIGTLAGALKFLPTGVVDFLLRPFPWERGSALATLTRPETVLYYIFLVPAALGILLAIWRTFGLALPLVTFLVIEVVGYALVISNFGTIYRERAPILLVLFVFAGVAMGELFRLIDNIKLSAVRRTELAE
jgi:hypothetical protein